MYHLYYYPIPYLAPCSFIGWYTIKKALVIKQHLYWTIAESEASAKQINFIFAVTCRVFLKPLRLGNRDNISFLTIAKIILFIVIWKCKATLYYGISYAFVVVHISFIGGGDILSNHCILIWRFVWLFVWLFFVCVVSVANVIVFSMSRVKCFRFCTCI